MKQCNSNTRVKGKNNPFPISYGQIKRLIGGKFKVYKVQGGYLLSAWNKNIFPTKKVIKIRTYGCHKCSIQYTHQVSRLFIPISIAKNKTKLITFIKQSI